MKMAFIQIDQKTALQIHAGNWQEVYGMSFDKEGAHEFLIEDSSEIESNPDWTFAIEGALLDTYESED